MLGREPPGALVAVHAEAALSGDANQPGVGAGRRGRGQLVAAQRGAADGSVDARTLVFAAGAETLAVLVNPAVVFARASL